MVPSGKTVRRGLRLWTPVLFLAVLAAPLGATETAEKKNCKLPAGDREHCHQCSAQLDPKQARHRVYTKKGIPERVFDDPGCMLKWRDEKCMPTQVELDSVLYVRDWATGEEVKAKKAFYVLASGMETPRGYGILAFRNEAAAMEFRRNHPGSHVMTYKTMVNTDVNDLLGPEEPGDVKTKGDRS